MRNLLKDTRGQALVENALVNMVVALGVIFILAVLSAALMALLASLGTAVEGYRGSTPQPSGPHARFVPGATRAGDGRAEPFSGPF